MSDSLTDAQKFIAGVIDAHRTKARWGNPDDHDFGRFQCSCGHLGETIKSTDGFMRARSDHLAVEIDKALGGLTRERSIRSQAYNDTSMTGDLEDLVDEIDLFSADHRIESRVVGGWIPEAGQ